MDKYNHFSGHLLPRRFVVCGLRDGPGECHEAMPSIECKDGISFENIDNQRTNSQRTTPVLTLTFSECFVPYWGISSDKSQASTTS